MIAKAWGWMCDPAYPERSWIGHTTAVLLLAIVFGVNVAIFFYFAREVEQAIVKHIAGEKQDWSDNLLDIVIPMFVLGVAAFVFGLK
jgi:Na+/H+-dicarboxylate symporter